MTTVSNIRQMAKARGYRINKIRSPYIDDKWLIIAMEVAVYEGGPNNHVVVEGCSLAEAEEWLREKPTLERPRKK